MERYSLINFNLIKKYNQHMKTDFKLTGLSLPHSFTCEPLNNENIFWVTKGLNIDKFNELWNYCKNNWSDKKIVEIEHDGLNKEGIPMNPIVIGIREVN